MRLTPQDLGTSESDPRALVALEDSVPSLFLQGRPLILAVVNPYRQNRVAEILSDFRTLQYYIAAAPVDPDNMEDYYTEGWAALRQCALDGQNILNCAADTSVPQRGSTEEQEKAELQQCVTLTPFDSLDDDN